LSVRSATGAGSPTSFVLNVMVAGSQPQVRVAVYSVFGSRSPSAVHTTLAPSAALEPGTSPEGPTTEIEAEVSAVRSSNSTLVR
jgi:hypothetical protein